jgi:hypothetical protein
MQPRQPMAPLLPMQPLVPMQPLRPGERRGDRPAPTPQYQQPNVSTPQPMAYAPPPSYQPAQSYQPSQQASPSVQQQVVNLGLSQSPVAGANWGGIPRPRVPTRVRRPSGGSNKAGAIVGIVVAAIVGLAALGSHSSSGNSHISTIPTFSASIPPISTGAQHAPTLGSPGHTGGSRAGASRPTHHSGRSLDLNGSFDGQRIRVTFLRLVNDATPKDAFMDAPSSGKRLVATQFRVKNIGSFIYVVSATSVAHVVDTKGHTYDSKFLFEDLREGKIFSGAIDLSAGESAVGYIGFEVPKNARIKKVEFSATSGGGQTGTWTFVRA